MTDHDDRNVKVWRAAADAYQRHGSGCGLLALTGLTIIAAGLVTLLLVPDWMQHWYYPSWIGGIMLVGAVIIFNVIAEDKRMWGRLDYPWPILLFVEVGLLAIGISSMTGWF